MQGTWVRSLLQGDSTCHGASKPMSHNYWAHMPQLLKLECPRAHALQQELLLFSYSVMSDSLWPHGLQHTRLPCPSLYPRVCLNSDPLSRWCHPTIPSSVVPFSSGLQSFPAPGSFLRTQVFASAAQSIGVSASASVLPMNIQGWFHLGLTGLVSLLSKGLSKVSSSTTVQRHQFFSAQPFSCLALISIHDYWKNHSLD